MTPRAHPLAKSLVLAAWLATTSAAASRGETRWSLITASDGAPIGHARREVVESNEGRTITETREIALKERHHGRLSLTERTVTRQDAAGRTRAISTISEHDKAWSRSDATIADDHAEIVRQTRTARTVASVAISAGVRFDGGEALLAGWDEAKTPRLEFENFSIDATAVERVVIEPAPGAAREADGGLRVIRRRYDGGELRALALMRLDRDNRVISVTQPMFGGTIEIRAADRATALAPHPLHEVDLDLALPSPFRISGAAAKGHIRYRIGFRDGLDFALPPTGEQRSAANPEGATLDICAACGSRAAGDLGTPADALKPTAWLQSDHPRLIAIARPIAKQGVSADRKMALLAQAARRYLPDVDYAGHFSALDALKRGAGDCTEDAVLLAALGRAAGIPTRVANGLVYRRDRFHGTSHAFMPHSWTLAWIDGAWRSYDMTIGGFDSTHIALTVGDGDARSVFAASQLASLLRFIDMAEIKRPPRN